MSIAVVNGKTCDHKHNISVRNLLINGNKIIGAGYIPDEDEGELKVIDITSCMMVTNTFDFFKVPDASDILSFTTTMQANGVCHLAFIPNPLSNPLDTPERIYACKESLGSLANQAVFIASATKLQQPNELAELSLLINAGATAIYFDRIIENDTLLKQALMQVNAMGVPIVFGPMTNMEKNGAHLNDGPTSFKIGINGEPEANEVSNVRYVLGLLDALFNGPVHFQCVSSPDALSAIHEFKSKRPNVTVGVSPFHAMFSDEVLGAYAGEFKLNPPLRSAYSMQTLNERLPMADHFTSLHAPVVGDSQASDFYSQSFGAQTMPYFYRLANHCFIHHDMTLDQYQTCLASPQPSLAIATKGLGLNANASFIALKTKKDTTDYAVFSEPPIPLYGGVELVMINGKVQPK